MENHTDIETLLNKYFEGSTTPAENERIEAWLHEDEEHLRIAKQLDLLYLAVDTQHIAPRINTEKALDRVRSKTKVRRSLSWWGWTQRVAAMLSIPLLIGVLLLYQDRQQPAVVAQMMEVRTNAGMTTSIMLPDSTVVHLNSESSLRYPTFFAGDTRRVELKGEAYFDVTHDAKKRFIVSTPYDSRIEVHGTRFNVEAYTDNEQISTTLVEGSVGFTYKDKAGEAQNIKLTPNHKLVYKPTSGEAKMYATSCESEIAWKDGMVVFNNTSMEDVLHMLSKRYNVEFIVNNSHIKEYSFTGTFSTQRLERIMEYFRISSQIKWRYLDSDDISDKKQKIEIY